MKTKTLLLVIASVCFLGMTTMPTGESNRVKINQAKDEDIYAKLSVRLIKTVKNGSEYQSITDSLADVSVEKLDKSLNTEGERKAFWLNVYNAYVQILLKEKPERLKTRNESLGYNFFSSDQITIAGEKLSFDEIEHDIIRRSKVKLSLGFMDKLSWFTDDFEERMRWDMLDPRIHFALNCGAKSCPEIAIYYPDRVNEQLDKTTKQFLDSTTEYHKESSEVAVTSLFNWYRGDFGGKDGIVPFLKKYEIIPQEANPSVSFKDYDWTVDLGNYKEL